MSIFAVAFIAVAVLIPTATTLQRQTLHEIQGNALEKNVTAILQARPFKVNTADLDLDDNTVVNNSGINSTYVQAINFDNINAKWKWTLSDRTFPTSSPHYNEAHKPSERRYVWVPLARRKTVASSAPYTANTEWEIYVFILKRELTDFDSQVQGTPNLAYHDQTTGGSLTWAIPTSPDVPNKAYKGDCRFPGVVKIPITNVVVNHKTQEITYIFEDPSSNLGNVYPLNAGDMFLDNTGNICWVKKITVDKTHIPHRIEVLLEGSIDRSTIDNIGYIWCSPRPKANLSSPTINILVLTNVVQ